MAIYHHDNIQDIGVCIAVYIAPHPQPMDLNSFCCCFIVYNTKLCSRVTHSTVYNLISALRILLLVRRSFGTYIKMDYII